MSGPPTADEPSPWPAQLYILYLLRSEHGTGLGPALLDAVLDADAGASLWVADPNPRAQAFYRKAGIFAEPLDRNLADATEGRAQAETRLPLLRTISMAISSDCS